MKDFLAQHFPVAPFVQAAPAGEWERAVRLTEDSDVAAILEMMSHGAKHIGMEVMWPGHAFAGTGWLAASWREGIAAATRDLATTCPHPVAVEFGLSGDLPAWIAFMVSEPGGPVDRGRLHDIVRGVVS